MVTPPAQAPSALPRLNAAMLRLETSVRPLGPAASKTRSCSGATVAKAAIPSSRISAIAAILTDSTAAKPKQHDRERGDHTEEALPAPVARQRRRSRPRLCLGGVGLARLALFHIGPDIGSGRLVPVLQSYNPGDREDIHAVYVGHAAPLPARVRAFIDFLAEHVRVSDPTLKRVADPVYRQ